MRLGYDVLLEKPVSNVPEHCIAIADEAKRLGRNVVVCHVLRYTPFYHSIKEIIASGKIGKIMNMQMNLQKMPLRIYMTESKLYKIS